VAGAAVAVAARGGSGADVGGAIWPAAAARDIAALP
jgi:hypothetical protein